MAGWVARPFGGEKMRVRRIGGSEGERRVDVGEGLRSVQSCVKNIDWKVKKRKTEGETGAYGRRETKKLARLCAARNTSTLMGTAAMGGWSRSAGGLLAAFVCFFYVSLFCFFPLAGRKPRADDVGGWGCVE